MLSQKLLKKKGKKEPRKMYIPVTISINGVKAGRTEEWWAYTKTGKDKIVFAPWRGWKYIILFFYLNCLCYTYSGSFRFTN